LPRNRPAIIASAITPEPTVAIVDFVSGIGASLAATTSAADRVLVVQLGGKVTRVSCLHWNHMNGASHPIPGSGPASTHTVGLVEELAKLPRETEWVEFKVDECEPHDIGEYISALSNSAALLHKAHGYLVWGIEDVTHQLVGTKFDPWRAKVGNEELLNWLTHLVSPKTRFVFPVAERDGLKFVVLEVDPAFRYPTQFQGAESIRVGSYKKRLKDHPDIERLLWQALDKQAFEGIIARENATADEVLRLIDYPALFELQGQPPPPDLARIIEALAREELVTPSGAGTWNISNLGAILFARRLADFPSLARKAIRVIQYAGNDRTKSLREDVGVRGYASGFAGLLQYIAAVLPSNEVIEAALRRSVPMFPELALRELAANALIHQDFGVTGAGPMVEVFSDRVEVTNPGVPLIDTSRFLDNPPRSRNEQLASLMRRIGICEERGSGVDKVVAEVEFYQLPAPIFEATKDATRAVLLAHRPLTRMSRDDRIRACYLHACLRYVNREFLTNRSIRERFGIAGQNIALASRLIREAVEAGLIGPHDPSASPRYRKYVPWWARELRAEGS
jgi:predicted HTH transcriptional regulator